MLKPTNDGLSRRAAHIDILTTQYVRGSWMMCVDERKERVTFHTALRC